MVAPPRVCGSNEGQGWSSCLLYTDTRDRGDGVDVPRECCVGDTRITVT